MILKLEKFGDVLTSRERGKEAFLAARPILAKLGKKEEVKIDFGKVFSLSPSWADEFLVPLQKKYGKRIVFKNTDNSSVRETISFLQSIGNLA